MEQLSELHRLTLLTICKNVYSNSAENFFVFFQQGKFSKDLPFSQEVPLPVNPVRHVQTNDPAVSMQSAWVEQLCRSYVHSSTATERA